MNANPQRRTFGVLLALSFVILGATVGGVLAGQLQRGGMGWDEIASALLGMMLGASAGVLLAIALARRLALRALTRVTAIASVLSVVLLVIGVMRVRDDLARAARDASTPGPRRPSATTPPP